MFVFPACGAQEQRPRASTDATKQPRAGATGKEHRQNNLEESNQNIAHYVLLCSPSFSYSNSSFSHRFSGLFALVFSHFCAWRKAKAVRYLPS
jgi:hypothetical protein